MNYKNIKEYLIVWGTKMFVVLITLALVLGILYQCNNLKKTNNTSSPVEDIRIDSISKANDKLIIEVNNLDSIKDAKIIEVKSLDNDSTLKLFYQLIGK